MLRHVAAIMCFVLFIWFVVVTGCWKACRFLASITARLGNGDAFGLNSVRPTCMFRGTECSRLILSWFFSFTTENIYLFPFTCRVYWIIILSEQCHLPLCVRPFIVFDLCMPYKSKGILSKRMNWDGIVRPLNHVICSKYLSATLCDHPPSALPQSHWVLRQVLLNLDWTELRTHPPLQHFLTFQNSEATGSVFIYMTYLAFQTSWRHQWKLRLSLCFL